MSQFAREALFIGIKEGLKLSFTLFLVLSYFRNMGLGQLKKSLFASVLIVFAASLLVMMTANAGADARNVVVRSMGYSFGLFYLFSLGALLHSAGTDMLGPLSRVIRKNIILAPLVFLLTVLYYVPDLAGSSLYVSDLFFMSGRRILIFVLAGTGLVFSLLAFLFVVRRTQIRLPSELFGLPQVLLFLALIKLMTGGVKGFTELSLIPSVQAGLIKLVHDLVHQTFVTIMVPDHPILTTTAWNFIGILFGKTVSLWLSFVVLVLPLVLFIKKHFSEPVPARPELQKGALTRLYIKSFKDIRLLKSLPVLAFLIVILTVWFVQQGESVTALYNPEPKPVVADSGAVTIPLHAPGSDLLDGNVHKFSLTYHGETYRLLAIKKPDGTLSLCLDACEICQPEGYAQGREHLVCLYCKTPIAFETVGRPGGCNPIPVTALVTDKEVRVEVPEIEAKWRTVNSAKNREITDR